MHKLEEAKEDFTRVSELAPEYGSGCFYYLGWIAEMKGDYDEALKNYDMSIVLYDTYPYVQMMKGNLLIDFMSRTEEGREIMLHVIEMEDNMIDPCKYYAYAALGERDKAVEEMNSIIALNPKDKGNYYDAAPSNMERQIAARLQFLFFNIVYPFRNTLYRHMCSRTSWPWRGQNGRSNDGSLRRTCIYIWHK